MATTEAQGSMVTRLAERGEEAVHRLADEAVKHPAVTDALGRANSARERLEELSRTVLAQLGVAPASDVDKLRGDIARLERRLKKLEAEKKAGAAASES
jgi:polyhydroxyalkanoate synthesis regulator phasin